MSGGWFAARSDPWEVLLEELPRPLSRAAALLDLAYLQDEVHMGRRVRPKRPELMARWGWSDHPVRTLLAKESEWSDPSKRPLWPDGGPAEVRRRSGGGPAEVRSDMGEPKQLIDRGPTEVRRRSDGGPTEVHTRGDPQAPSPSPSPIETPLPPAPPPPRGAGPGGSAPEELRLFDRGPTSRPKGHLEAPDRTALEDGPTLHETAPKWACGHRGTPPIAVLEAVTRSLEAIRGKPPDPHRCATEAAEILGLWRKLDRPPISAFADELVLVARWAQGSEDGLAARDIRAEGWDKGTNRSRSVATLCVRKSWGDRLEAARAWEARGAPVAPPAPAPHVRGHHPSYGPIPEPRPYALPKLTGPSWLDDPDDPGSSESLASDEPVSLAVLPGGRR